MLVHGIFHTRILEWVAIPSLEIFPTQELSQGLLHCNPLQCSCLENPRDGGAWWLLSMGSHRVGHD